MINSRVAQHRPLFACIFWSMLTAGFVLIPLLEALDFQGYGFRVHYGRSYGLSGGGAYALGVGLLLALLAPWFLRRSMAVRVALSLAIGFVWLVATDVSTDYLSVRYSRQEHAREIEAAYNERVLPALAYVRDFYQKEHRLPAFEELDGSGWIRGDDGISVYSDANRLEGQGIPGKDFILETYVSDWFVGIRSWDGTRFESSDLDL